MLKSLVSMYFNANDTNTRQKVCLRVGERLCAIHNKRGTLMVYTKVLNN